VSFDVSALSDADKTLPVVDPAIRALLPGLRLEGTAFTVVAEDDHLPLFAALDQAAPGDVLVIATGGGRRAVFGELFATEARRRGLAGLAVDGYCRDLRGLREIGLPIYARGTTPASGTTVSRAPAGQAIVFGGVPVEPGFAVHGDDDGLLIAPAAQVQAAREKAEYIARAEAAMLAGMARGVPLHDHTNFVQHAARLDAGEDSSLAFTVDV
jgi:regulator of RNase E activity RraA